MLLSKGNWPWKKCSTPGTTVTGGAKLAIHETVRYANEREQFNKKISSFGAIPASSLVLRTESSIVIAFM